MHSFIKKAVRRCLVTGLGLILAVGGCAASASAAGRLGWSQEQAALWQRMRQENHTFWRRLNAEAGAGRYLPGDHGLRDGMLYLITGDKAHAEAAWHHVNQWCGRTYRGNHPEDPGWCDTNWKGKIPRDGTREKFMRLAILYHWIRDGLPASDRSHMRDILEHWADLVTSDRNTHGTRLSDSDETVGHYFGMVLYALAIRDEDPERSQELLNFGGTRKGHAQTKPLGGLDATGANTETWRNAIARFAQVARGGQWLESSSYNRGTVRLLLHGVEAVNRFLGENKFPEVTALYPDFARALVQELTPDLRDFYQWGDNQLTHQIRHYARVATLSMVGGITKDPEALYMFDQMLARTSETVQEDYLIYVDPYAPRQAPQGQQAYHAAGRGIAYYHEGWEKKDSFFGSQFPNPTYVDHRLGALSNFALYRNRHWVINNPRGYYGHWDDDLPYQNTLLLHGAMGVVEEAYGETGYASEPGYLYHAGVTGGQYRSWGYEYPPQETVHEWSRAHLYLQHFNGTESVVVFDRVNSEDPRTAQSAKEYKRLPKRERQRLEEVDGRHQWIMHTPEPPQIEEGVISWKADGGERVTLVSLMRGFSVKVVDERAEHNRGGPYYLGGYMKKKDLAYQVRLVPDSREAFQTFCHVIHVGGPVRAKAVRASAGEQAEGVFFRPGGSGVAVIFNGTPRATPPPTKPRNDRVVHDAQRFNQLAKLRLFRQGFTVSLPTSDEVEVYVTDLDPDKSWSAEVNGKPLMMTVNDAGVTRFLLPPSPETYTLEIRVVE